MSIQPSLPALNMPHYSEGHALDSIYQHVHLRIEAAKHTMPGIKLEDESRLKEAIVSRFQKDLTTQTDNPDTVKTSVQSAFKALEDLDWALDKKITLAQLTVFYFRILSNAEVTQAEVESEAAEQDNAPANRLFPLAKQAFLTLENARNKFEQADRKEELEKAANECFSELTKIKSSILKDRTFTDIEKLIQQTVKQANEEEHPELAKGAEQILDDSKQLLHLGKDNEILTPENAAAVIVEISNRLVQLVES